MPELSHSPSTENRLFPLTWCSSASRHLWEEPHYLRVLSSRSWYAGYQAATFLVERLPIYLPPLVLSVCLATSLTFDCTGSLTGELSLTSIAFHSKDQPRPSCVLRKHSTTMLHPAPSCISRNRFTLVSRDRYSDWLTFVCVTEINDDPFTNFY